MPGTSGTRGATAAAADAAAVSDADIDRTASLWLERHGAAALAEARRMAAARRHAGDLAGADHWLRLIVAIERRTRWQGG